MTQAKTQMEVSRYISILANKWTARVVLSLADGPKRLSQLEAELPKASKKMIVESLRRLTDQDFVVRVDLTEKLRHVEYSLAEDGLKLLSVLRLVAEIENA